MVAVAVTEVMLCVFGMLTHPGCWWKVKFDIEIH